jgi:hypothetical protein
MQRMLTGPMGAGVRNPMANPMSRERLSIISMASLGLSVQEMISHIKHERALD